jgi:hypothetical protein
VTDLVDWKAQSKKYSASSYENLIREKMLGLAVTAKLIRLDDGKLFWAEEHLALVNNKFLSTLPTEDEKGNMKYVMSAASAVKACFPDSPFRKALETAKITALQVYTRARLIGPDGELTAHRTSWVNALDRFKESLKENESLPFKEGTVRELLWPEILVNADKAYLAFMKDTET